MQNAGDDYSMEGERTPAEDPDRADQANGPHKPAEADQADATTALWVGTSLYKQALYRLHQINDQLKPPRKFLAKLGTHPTLQERLERVGRLE